VIRLGEYNTHTEVSLQLESRAEDLWSVWSSDSLHGHMSSSYHCRNGASSATDESKLGLWYNQIWIYHNLISYYITLIHILVFCLYIFWSSDNEEAAVSLNQHLSLRSEILLRHGTQQNWGTYSIIRDWCHRCAVSLTHWDTFWCIWKNFKHNYFLMYSIVTCITMCVTNTQLYLTLLFKNMGLIISFIHLFF